MRSNEPLAPHTTLGIGGPARWFRRVRTEAQLKEAVRRARNGKIPWMVVGAGSNLLVSDRGFPGLIVKNEIAGIRRTEGRLSVKGGTLLQDLVDYAGRRGLGGLERMTGIPGTVAGAVYGNAGAYGQTIGERILSVRAFDGQRERRLSARQGRFSYRGSVFKERKDLVILEAELVLEPADPAALRETAAEIRSRREEKYPPGLLCPGSFFKNIRAQDLSAEVLRRIPPEKIVYGKVPAGYLLEAVGARGKSFGGVEIASYHGNLFFNTGGGTAREFWSLAEEQRRRVEKKFGIRLQPEVQLVGEV